MHAQGRLALAAVLLLLSCHRLLAVVRYTVTLADPVRHLVRISMELPGGSDAHEAVLPRL